MNISIERKRNDCSPLARGDMLRKTGITAGKVDVYYYSQPGKKTENRPQLPRHLTDSIDISAYDYITQNQNPSSQLLMQHPSLKRKLGVPTTLGSSPTTPPVKHHDYSRGIRADASLVPPIRQTASIFKQPVTIHKMQEGMVKTDLKPGNQDKPKQLFWEKRLEGLRACDIDGSEFGPIELPRGLKAVGPFVNDGTLLQSVATSLHVSSHPVTGQTASKNLLTTNPGTFLNPDQPLMHALNVSEDDIKRQEDRVTIARKKLQDALRV